MAGKLIALNDAAKMLGMTPDELVELRSRNEIHGYRDGASWKFKQEEIERVAMDRGIDLPQASASGLGDLDLVIEGSSMNLADSSFAGLDGDLGLSGLDSDLSPMDPAKMITDAEDDLSSDVIDERSVVGESDVRGKSGGSELGSGLDAMIELAAGDSDAAAGSDLGSDLNAALGGSDVHDQPVKSSGSNLGSDLNAALGLDDDDSRIASDDSGNLGAELADALDLDKGSAIGSSGEFGIDSGINAEIDLASEADAAGMGSDLGSELAGALDLSSDEPMDAESDLIMNLDSAVDIDGGETGGESDLAGAQESAPESEPTISMKAPPAAGDSDIDELMSEPAIDDEDSDDNLESILVSEESLGHSGESASSTIIGKKDKGRLDPDSDIQLGADTGDVEIKSGIAGSGINLVAGGSDLGPGSDLSLGGDTGIDSDVQLQPDAEGSGVNLVADELESPSGLGMGSDLSLGGDSEIGSDVELVPDTEGSGVNLIAGGSDAITGSDIRLGDEPSGSTGGGSSTGGSGTGKLVADGSDISIQDDDLELALGSELSLMDDDEISLDGDVAAVDDDFQLEDSVISSVDDDMQLEDAEDDAEDLTLDPSPSGLLLDDLDDDDAVIAGHDSATGSGLGSDIGSDIELDTDDDDDDLDVMLAGSAAGSDLTLGSDSGINLSPTDSGLSLEEEPLDLGGSSIEQLELPEDEDMISLEDEMGDPDAATQLKADDEFLLTPIEETDDESSGSQVIALEDSEVYADENAQTMLGGAPSRGMQQPLVAEDADFLLTPSQQQDAPGATAQPVAMVGPAPTHMLPEAKYSIWNVMGLMLALAVLGVTGTLMVDLMRNLWEFNEPVAASSSLIDSIIKAINLQP